ncbi:class I SAM-dependent methyltransferase [Cryptosporangium minutisporangium]|uniref:Class I SAM-dependent methyltransferase n=1 Tax=Cryptosporangium minutisporangium TaxID=113569 RepID=A0ABP6SSH6_9ACTN
MSQEDHDHTGKFSFDHIYTAPDPRSYFTTLRQLEYNIPGIARPHFARLIAEYRAVHGVSTPKVLDLGCSYGVNAALLRCDTTMAQLYERYGAALGVGRHRTRDELIEADRRFVRDRHRSDQARFVGLDVSQPALDYAVAAGFLDDALVADLEANEPTEVERAVLAGTDLVISTGCIGYVTEKTLLRIVEAAGGRRPWMAHFCLRMFPFDAIAGHLDDLGYETVRIDQPFRQRRFATAHEQASVLDRLTELGLDARGLEADGWFYAQLHISRPRPESQ